MTACTLHSGQSKAEDLMETDLIARLSGWEKQTECRGDSSDFSSPRDDEEEIEEESEPVKYCPKPRRFECPSPFNRPIHR